MNNKEAAKALLEGKTLRIINKSHKNVTYIFNKESLSIKASNDNDYNWNITDFSDNCEWEEVKEPYKYEYISSPTQFHTKAYNLVNSLTQLSEEAKELPDGKYKITIEEIE
jgi:hypothetical protein